VVEDLQEYHCCSSACCCLASRYSPPFVHARDFVAALRDLHRVNSYGHTRLCIGFFESVVH
jgi:hypothetical protein